MAISDVTDRSGGSLSFGFVVDNVLVAKTSISWKTPSLRKAGLYSEGSFCRRRSTSCRTPMMSDG